MSLGYPEDHSIPVRFFNRIRNFGDALNPYVIEHISNKTSRFAFHEEEHILSIGSVLFMANEKSLIWGTGLLNPSSHVPELKKEQIFALRGRKTYDFLQTRGLDLGDIPFGDPGIFASRLIPENKVPPKYKAVVVPHHSSINHDFYKSVAREEGVVIGNVLSNGLGLLEQIRDCEVVIAESLHGLIFAESFSKPSVWITQHCDDADWDFKFRDWFSTTQNPETQNYPLDLPFSTLVRLARRSGSAIDLTKLERAFPLSAGSQTSKMPLMDFRECRSYAPPVLFLDQDELLLNSFSAPQPDNKFALGAGDLRNRFFQSWAEPTYLCFLFSAALEAVPTPKQLAWCCRQLDQDIESDYALLISKDAESEGSRECVWKPAELPQNLSDSPVIGCIIRPDFSDITNKWIAFAPLKAQ